MDHDALPRLSARLVEAVSAPGSSDALKVSNINSARRMPHPRSLMPKSAGASSPQRRITGGTHPSGVRVNGVANGDGTAHGCKPVTTPDSFIQRRLSGHNSQQTARPSSTRASPRQVSHTTSSNQVAFGDQQGVQRLEWDVVQGENEQLRREVSLLQQKLVEKMRGNAKILVSGGQFRAPVGPPFAKAPGPQNTYTSAPGSGVQPCNTCVSLRASYKKARDTADQEQRVLAYRISQLERGESEAQASRNQQEEELTSLRHQLHKALVQNAATEAMMKLRIEELQQLQDDSRRLRRENEALHSQATIRDAANRTVQSLKNAAETQTDDDLKGASLSQTDSPRIDAGHRQLEEAQASNAELERSLEVLRAQLSAMEVQLAQTSHDRAEERTAAQEQLAQSQMDCSILASQKAGLVSKVSALEILLQGLQQQTAASEASHSDFAAAWQQECLAKDEQLVVLENHRAEADALATATRYRIEELEGLLTEATRRCQTHDSRVQDTVREIEILKRELCLKEDELGEKAKELAALKTQHELDVEESRVKSKALEAAQLECTRSQTESSKLQNAVDGVSVRLAAAEAELAARELVHSQLKRSHAAALEKALQSVVRLCVVAPTVNVHLTNNASATASSSSVVTCRPTLPHKQVRAVVEQDVLPLFATVFVQPQEGCTPQGGPMDQWLQNLLRDMQESLATHLQKLYSATTTVAPTD